MIPASIPSQGDSQKRPADLARGPVGPAAAASNARRPSAPFTQPLEDWERQPDCQWAAGWVDDSHCQLDDGHLQSDLVQGPQRQPVQQPQREQQQRQRQQEQRAPREQKCGKQQQQPSGMRQSLQQQLQQQRQQGFGGFGCGGDSARGDSQAELLWGLLASGVARETNELPSWLQDSQGAPDAAVAAAAADDHGGAGFRAAAAQPAPGAAPNPVRGPTATVPPSAPAPAPPPSTIASAAAQLHVTAARAAPVNLAGKRGGGAVVAEHAGPHVFGAPPKPVDTVMGTMGAGTAAEAMTAQAVARLRDSTTAAKLEAVVGSAGMGVDHGGASAAESPEVASHGPPPATGLRQQRATSSPSPNAAQLQRLRQALLEAVTVINSLQRGQGAEAREVAAEGLGPVQPGAVVDCGGPGGTENAGAALAAVPVQQAPQAGARDMSLSGKLRLVAGFAASLGLQLPVEALQQAALTSRSASPDGLQQLPPPPPQQQHQEQPSSAQQQQPSPSQQHQQHQIQCPEQQVVAGANSAAEGRGSAAEPSMLVTGEWPPAPPNNPAAQAAQAAAAAAAAAEERRKLRRQKIEALVQQVSLMVWPDDTSSDDSGRWKHASSCVIELQTRVRTIICNRLHTTVCA